MERREGESYKRNKIATEKEEKKERIEAGAESTKGF
jgi:hypothetical protein